MGENLFLDTNALIQLQKEAFEVEKFYISSITLHELENIKTAFNKDEEVKYRARKALHLLRDNQDKYEVIVYNTKFDKVLKKYNLPDTPDSRIIVSALSVGNVKFMTNDLACYMIAKSVGLKTSLVKEDALEDNYTGFVEVSLDDAEQVTLYSIIIPQNVNRYNLINNQYLIIKDSNHDDKIIDSYKWVDDCGYLKVGFINAESSMFGKVRPKDGDVYQQIALDSMANNKITMLRGAAGSGKSYLAFGYMFHLLEKGKIDKIIVFCNTVATKGSAKLGFYPGSRTEKLLDSQIGNLLESKLGDRSVVEKLINDGDLVLLPMSDVRGYDTSGMNAAVYITEAQNMDIDLMKLALQRIGDDSICILDGDDKTQVDMSMYAGANNGMKRVSKVFRGTEVYGEVTLQKIFRSKIAAIADKM